MKNKIISIKAYRIVAVMMLALIIGTYFAASNITIYANDIVITGNAAGALSITSTDTMLFELTGLYPGDTKESSVTISNADMVNDGFEVFMYASNTLGTEYDLGQVTKLTVTADNTTVYDGMLINFDENTNKEKPISLGRLAKGTNRKLDFAIEIDGEKTDNNYQEQQSHFVVTFVANTYGGSVPTTPPGDGNRGGGVPIPREPREPVEMPSDTVVINEQSVPLSNIEIVEQIVPIDNADPEPEAEHTIHLDDEPIPLYVVKKMPKTGEVSLVLYIVMGAIITGFGLFIIMSKGNKEG